ncbi:MAG: universal stress protein [Planctomycetota bacterium]
MKVLIAVDGSESSLHAVSLAGRLLHAASQPAPDEIAFYFSPLELKSKLRGRSPAVLDGAEAGLFDEAKSRLPLSLAKHVRTILGTQSAAAGIVATADDWQADLIVVGARGASLLTTSSPGIASLKAMLLGSVSRAVLHGARQPVLVVRGLPPADCVLPVLVCHHEASASAVAEAIGMLHWPNTTQGRVIGVAESLLAGPLPQWLEKRVRDPDTAAIATAWEEEHAAERASLEARLKAFQHALPSPFRHHAPVIVEGNPAEKIVACAKAGGDALIVVGRTPTDRLTRWLLGSTSEAVLTHSEASVLLVPVEK